MKPEATFRDPTKWEHAMLERLFEADFPGKDQLRTILSNIQVRTIDKESSIELQSSVEGSAPVIKTIPVEAEAKDSDGFTIHVLFHAAGGRPVELEIYKDDGSQVNLMPDASHFEVIVLAP